MKRKIDEVILYVKKYIIKKYNYFSINISDNFIGVKFHKDRYYIFYYIKI